MELEKLRSQLKSQLQQHQILIQQIKTDPQNPDLQKKLQGLQAHITSLSEQQSHVVKQLRQELMNKAEFRGEENNIKSPLSDNHSNNITSHDYKEAVFPTSRSLVRLEPSTRMEFSIKTEPLDVKPVKFTPQQKPLPIQLPRLKPKPPPVVIVSQQHGKLSSLAQILHQRYRWKMEFMAALGLITPQTLIELLVMLCCMTIYMNVFYHHAEEKSSSKGKSEKEGVLVFPPQNALDIDPEFNSAPNSPKPSSPVPNGIGGYVENGKHKKFKYKRVITADSPVDEDDNHDEVCTICRESGELLLCDTCNLVYHMSCLDPPLTAVPPGMWLCPRCKERVEEDEPMPWPGTLAVVHSYLAHKTAKEVEKNKLLKRSEELKAERVELEAKAKQLSNAIMEQMQAKSELSASNKSAKNSVNRLITFIELVQSL
ncbi:histone binding [Desmophyllum pertusum]|uniref:Histone binding n=1 Tax=Desmophyllum pertusum TaxID=174260 RepID=A0A9X0CP61_9CNID|nr:histone binding [Desmophyllum pertusum]